MVFRIIIIIMLTYSFILSHCDKITCKCSNNLKINWGFVEGKALQQSMVSPPPPPPAFDFAGPAQEFGSGGPRSAVLLGCVPFAEKGGLRVRAVRKGLAYSRLRVCLQAPFEDMH